MERCWAKSLGDCSGPCETIMSENDKLNTGILNGVGLEIDAWLNDLLPRGWRKGRRPHFSNGNTYKQLKASLEDGERPLDCTSLVSAIDKTLHRNLAKVKRRQPSPENWRFEPHPEISPKNRSPEVCLEREIVRLQKRSNWANQSPVASGLLGPDSDKGRHVDLVREIEPSIAYELIELKWGADNPFFAAMEILCYGLIYLLFREKFPKEDKPLLQASTIHLMRVLATEDFYRGKRAKSALKALELQIGEAVRKHAAQLGIKMDFRYLRIPFSKGAKVIIEDDDRGMPSAF
jgi:hypothetical protein